MPRAIWSGAISFGLVNIPVKLYSAVSRKTVRFHQIDAESGQRIRQQRVNPTNGEEIPYEQIVKGYEISPDKYVTITPEELEAIQPQKTRGRDRLGGHRIGQAPQRHRLAEAAAARHHADHRLGPAGGNAVKLDPAVQHDEQRVGRIVLQLLVPFLLGLLCGRWVGGWVRAHRKQLTLLDRGVIVAVVYAAFSRGVRQGVWQEVGPLEVAVVLACAALLLTSSLAATWWVPRLWGTSRADRVTILFCGSNKSLATGLPMATVLFDPHVVGLVALPIILYHPLQITVCSFLATRLGRVTGTPAFQG